MLTQSVLYLVETVGIEPMTSCMSSMRSNQLSYASATHDIIAYAEGFVKGVLKSFLRFFAFSEDSVLYRMGTCYEMIPYSYTTVEKDTSSESM